MEAYQNEIVDLDPEVKKHIRRRSLLPWWIKVFIWIFMVFGIFVPIGLVIGIMGGSFKLSMYGLETYDALSILGLSMMAIFAFKTFVALGLWSEKVWAVKFGQWDAVLGIVICIFVMLIYPSMVSSVKFNIRLELILLIPYLIKLNKIKEAWEQQ